MTSALSDYLQTSGMFLSIPTVVELIQKGANVNDNHSFPLKKALEYRNVPLINVLLQNGAVVTPDMLTSLAKRSDSAPLLIALLNERDKLPFTFGAIQSLAFGPLDILTRAVQSVARGHPSRDVVEQYITFLIKLPVLEPFSAFVRALEINVDDFLEHAQETVPTPIRGQEYVRSKRGVTKMRRLLGRIPERIQVDKSEWILEHNELCFCWNIDIGERKDMYIPVTRYGESAGIGYYGGSVHYEDPSFTWYYVEPDSELVLYAPRVFVARNKIQAFMLLYRYPGIADEFEKENEDLFYALQGELKKAGIYYDEDEHEEHLLSPSEIPIDDEKTVTTFFRDWNERKVYFEGGKMDFLDETLSKLLTRLNIDVLILTHQSGNYGRLVSECLDVRKRSVSFSNIYQI